MSFASDSAKNIVAWARQRSLWTVTMGGNCCGASVLTSGFIQKAFGSMLGVMPANGLTNADLLVIVGSASPKMSKILRAAYDRISNPKYVITFDSCDCSTLPNYINPGAIVPINVRFKGCIATLDDVKKVVCKLKVFIGSRSLDNEIIILTHDT